MLKRFKNILFILTLFLIPLPINAGTEQEISGAYSVKAAYLYNFTKFVEWPADRFNIPKEPFILYILGENHFKNALKTIKNKKIGLRKLKIKFCKSIREIKNCHILYISSSEKKNLNQILSEISGQPILTVSSIDNFATHGGMIHLFRTENQIHFNINIDAATISRLKISSQLLKLAGIVKENTN